jgi:hypothetical protein
MYLRKKSTKFNLYRLSFTEVMLKKNIFGVFFMPHRVHSTSADQRVRADRHIVDPPLRQVE